MTKISVIIPVYNVEDYLDVCLDSVIMQSFKDFEVICINDGTKDDCGQILEQYAKFDKRIKIITQENKGLSAARNTGLAAAKGKYITFVDSDDYISPIMLEKLYENITRNKSDFVFCNQCIFNSKTEDLQIWDFLNKDLFNKQVNKECFCENDVSPEIYEGMHVSAYGKLYSKEFIKDFRFPEGLIFEDVPFFAQCFLTAKKISYDFNPYYFYRVEREGSIIKSADRRFKDIFEIQKLRNDIFKKYGKYEKYKNIIMFMQMKDLIQKLCATQGKLRQEMFELAKNNFSQIDFSEFDLNKLNQENVYAFWQKMLKMEFKEFNNLLEVSLRGSQHA